MNGQEIREEQIIFGWQSADEAARDVYGSLHSQLLNGRPVFLYKSTTLDSTLVQVVVVKNIEDGRVREDYGVGIITRGWTSLYPRVPVDYLETDLLHHLKEWKIDKDVIKMYEQIINQEKKNV